MTPYVASTCTANSDDGRQRRTTKDISPTYVKQVLELQKAGATEEGLHPIATEAVTDSYFTQ